MPRAFLVKKTANRGSFVDRSDRTYYNAEILHENCSKSTENRLFQPWHCVSKTAPSYPVYLGQNLNSKSQIRPNIIKDGSSSDIYENYEFYRPPIDLNPQLSNPVTLTEPMDLSGAKSTLRVSPTSAFDRVTLSSRNSHSSSPPNSTEFRNQNSLDLLSMRATSSDSAGSSRTATPLDTLSSGLLVSHHDAASVFRRDFGGPTRSAAIHSFAKANTPYYFKDAHFPLYVDLMKEHRDPYFIQGPLLVYPSNLDDPTKREQYDFSPKYTSDKPVFPKNANSLINGHQIPTPTTSPERANISNISPKFGHMDSFLALSPTPSLGYPEFGRAQKRIARQPILGVEYIENSPSFQDRESPNQNKSPSWNQDMQETTIGTEKMQKPSPVPGQKHLGFGNPNKSCDLPKSGTGAATKPSQPKKYICDVCGKGFSRSNTLVTHKRIHTGDKPFECELCGRAFRQPGNLTRHRLTHTTVKPYECTQCGKAFNRASNLSTHMRTHTDYKPFVCLYCGKGFHQKIDMKIHSYTHTGEKPHKCKTCRRGFKQLTHLTYHMRTHSDVKMYTCTYCGKGFNQKGNLQAHIYGHTGERPYHCEICNKGFTLSSTLNTHRRTHIIQKPYICHYCGKDFYQKTALKGHMLVSHPYTESVL